MSSVHSCLTYTAVGGILGQDVMIPWPLCVGKQRLRQWYGCIGGIGEVGTAMTRWQQPTAVRKDRAGREREPCSPLFLTSSFSSLLIAQQFFAHPEMRNASIFFTQFRVIVLSHRCTAQRCHTSATSADVSSGTSAAETGTPSCTLVTRATSALSAILPSPGNVALCCTCRMSAVNSALF